MYYQLTHQGITASFTGVPQTDEGIVDEQGGGGHSGGGGGGGGSGGGDTNLIFQIERSSTFARSLCSHIEEIDNRGGDPRATNRYNIKVRPRSSPVRERLGRRRRRRRRGD